MTIKLSGDLMDNFTEIITTVAQWDNVEAEVIMHITNKLEAAIIVEIENQLVAAVEQSYAEHPVSITEERATRADQGNLWTPRDCLLQVLRDMDRGKITPVDLLVAYSEQADENVMGVYTRTACRTFFNTVALLDIAKTLTTS